MQDIATPARSGASTPASCASSSASSRSDKPFLLRLPTELIDSVLDLLEPADLAILSRTCHTLRRYANDDSRWRRHVQRNVPDVVVDSSYPFKTYRELYACHEPYWFLTRYKIWFCDHNLTGKIILVRYDQRRGCIEGYLLLSDKSHGGIRHWPADPQVIIHAFEPKVKLHLDKPVLQLRPHDVNRRPCFTPEVPMDLDEILHCNLVLAEPLKKLPQELGKAPSYGIWPPPAIPSSQRVGSTAPYGFAEPKVYSIPKDRAGTADHIFRIRQWIEHIVPARPAMINGRPLNPAISSNPYSGTGLFGAAMAPAILGRGNPIGEEVITYSTLDPYLYTPTEDKPWRGIWVGDYCGHGCEFLLVHQPDDQEPAEPRRHGESEEEYRHRRMYRGRLEAIKLTGDVNVPRGEYTFISEDLGEAGFVAESNEPPFIGCRIVKSKGHIAGTSFLNDQYIDSQLVLINENRLAQFWLGFGHISFFERVDINRFLDPRLPDPKPRGPRGLKGVSELRPAF